MQTYIVHWEDVSPSYLLHFTLFPAQATFLHTVSFLPEGEPPPPRSTPWGAYRSGLSGGAAPLIVWPFCAAFTHSLTRS